MVVGMNWCSSLQLVRGASLYSLYVLLILLLAYFLNQLDRYTLAIVAKPLAQELHYGDQGCLKNDSLVSRMSGLDCLKERDEEKCLGKEDGNGTLGCKWDYTGEGTDYQILAGPMFILIYTFAGIPVGIAADAYNRKPGTKGKRTYAGGWWVRLLRGIRCRVNIGVLLGLSVALWSLCTLLSGFVDSYWQLAVLRFGLGLGQAGCNPFATSLISDYFPEHLRGSALGVYNWGIYTGYSMSFALGNLITNANINGQGWRWAFIIAGIPGIFLGLIILLTVREPKKDKPKSEVEVPAHELTVCGKLASIFQSLRPSILLLCLAGAIRNAAGYVWAYNTQAYFVGIGQTNLEIAAYLSWVPFLGGSIGVVLGGFISDRFVKKSGPHGRIWVLIGSQILAAPFAAGVLILPPPWAYISLIPTYIIGEMWVGVTLAVLVELVPPEIKTTCIAAYFFIISNIGGNMPLLVPIIRPWFENLGYPRPDDLRYTLLCLYPGEYVIGSALFLLTLFVLKRDIAYIQSLGSQRVYKSTAEIVGNMELAESKESLGKESTKV